ncbi:MAG: hypothetical protein ACOY45_04090 [Pseudomonadota bacterium]
MIALSLLAVAVAAQSVQIDWSALPPLPYRNPPALNADMHRFALREAHRSNCPLVPPVNGVQNVRVDVAVLVDPEGNVRVAVPRAIDCPVVEQYAAGLVTSFTRNNLLPRTATEDQWFAASITFSWRS